MDVTGPDDRRLAGEDGSPSTTTVAGFDGHPTWGELRDTPAPVREHVGGLSWDGTTDGGPDCVTVLHAVRRSPLVPVVRLSNGGDVVTHAASPARRYAARTVVMDGIAGLHAFLSELEGDPRACLVRGRAAPETTTGARVSRMAATFPETPRSWVMIRLERVPLAGISVLDDPWHAAEAVLELLAVHAPETAGVSAVVQFASAAGLTEAAAEGVGRPPRRRGAAEPWVSAHVWLWLHRPLGGPEIRSWIAPVRISARQAGLTITAAAGTVEPHLPALAVFEAPLRDPLAGRRTLLVRRAADAADLAIPVGTDLDDWLAPSTAQDPRQQDTAAATTAVAPTFPSAEVSLAEGRRMAKAAVDTLVTRVRDGEAPELLLRVTVGAGKTEAAIGCLDALLDAGIVRAAAADKGAEDRDGPPTLVFLVPRHNLGAEIARRVAAMLPGLTVEVWRGMDSEDPERPGYQMCLDPELPRAAVEAGLSGGEVCVACHLKGRCGYRAQWAKAADIWIAAHQMGFLRLPRPLGAPVALVVDESLLSAGVAGTDELHPIQLPVSALADDRTGTLRGLTRQHLLHLRGMAARALTGHPDGGLLRARFEEVGFTSIAAEEWLRLEWMTKPDVDLRGAAGREEVLERLRDAAAEGFTPRRPQLARAVRDLLAGTDARSVTATVHRNAPLGRDQGTGDAVRFEWRKELSKWACGLPKLLLDATTHADVVRLWAPRLETVEIAVAAPAQQVRQIVGRKFGRRFFTANPRNVVRLADLILAELALTSGSMLAIVQKEVEALLAAEVGRRIETQGGLRRSAAKFEFPSGAVLHLAHHGAIAGLDAYRDVDHLVVVGSPATNRVDGERLAEILRGRAGEVVTDAEDLHWPTVTGGIRMADGTGVPVAQPRHPDPLVEAVRWSITEGSALQAVGRARGVQRIRPVRVMLLAELATSVTVASVMTWDEALPDRTTLAAAEAALMRRAVPLAPADLAKARPDFKLTEAGIKTDLRRSERGQSLISSVHKGLTPFAGFTCAQYRRGEGGGRWSAALVPPDAGREALDALLGSPSSAFELVYPAAPEPVAPVAWLPRATVPALPVVDLLLSARGRLLASNLGAATPIRLPARVQALEAPTQAGIPAALLQTALERGTPAGNGLPA